eukprot:g7795.t1
MPPPITEIEPASDAEVSENETPVVLDIREEVEVVSELSLRKTRPLNFFDKFQSVGGIPTVCLTLDNKAWDKNIKYSMSDDGSRMAINAGKGTVKVYDAFDNYSLVARSRHLGRNIEFVRFWNSTNDELVAITGGRRVCFLALRGATGFSSTMTEYSETGPFRLEIIKEFEIPHPDDNIWIWVDAVSLYETTLWVVDDGRYSDRSMLIYSLDVHEVHRMKLEDVSGEVNFTYLCIPQGSCMGIVLAENIEYAKTRVWFDLRSEQSGKNSKFIEIDGHGLGWSDEGESFLLWKVKDNGLHQVHLCSTEDLKTGKGITPFRKAEMTVGVGVLHVKAKYLTMKDNGTRSSIRTNGNKVIYVAVLALFPKGAALFLWNTTDDKITKEIDLFMLQVVDDRYNSLEFCISPNEEWLAVICLNSGKVALVSFSSGVLVWQHTFNVDLQWNRVFDNLRFDATNSRLIVRSEKTVFVISPPCLLEHDHLMFKCLCVDVIGTSKSIGSKLAPYRALIPKRILFDLLKKFIPSDIEGSLLDVTAVSFSPDAAFVINVRRRVKVYTSNFEQLFSSQVKDLFNDAKRKKSSQGAKRIHIRPELTHKGFANKSYTYIFAFPTRPLNGIGCVLFYLKNQVQSIFIDLKDKRNQQLITYKGGKWFGMKQNNQGNRVTCLGEHGVLIIDLNQRAIVHDVVYRANFLYWLYTLQSCYRCFRRPIYISGTEGDNSSIIRKKIPSLFKSYGLCDISKDGEKILLGWNMRTNQRVMLTSQMVTEELSNLETEANNIIPCWALSEDLEKLAFFDVYGNERRAQAICVYSHKGKEANAIYLENFALHRMSLEASSSRGMELCPTKALVQNESRDFEDPTVNLIPFTPYSLEHHIPSLHTKDYFGRSITTDELQECISQFGVSFLNMKFNGITNFQLACCRASKDLALRLMKIVKEHGIDLDIRWNKEANDKNLCDSLKKAIIDKDSSLVRILLDAIKDQSLKFCEAAITIRKNFENLWLSYHGLIEPLFVDNLLSWDVCELEVSSSMFSENAHDTNGVGTSDTFIDWQLTMNRFEAGQYWEVTNDNHERSLKEEDNSMKLPVSIRYFCITNICKIGTNGIIRFLLFQQAPSHIFKVDIVKWTITYKWEYLWKKHFFKMVLKHGCLAVAFTSYTVCLAYLGKDFKESSTQLVHYLSGCLLILSIILAWNHLMLEFTQIKTYIRDGKQLLPKDRFLGIKHYFQSGWNVVEFITYFLIVFVIPLLHGLTYHNSSNATFLCSFVSFATILIWIKVWYFAQAFEQTGVFVLLIENVIRDCRFFLVLSLVVLVGFSFAMFVVFRHILNEGILEQKENNGDKYESNDLHGTATAYFEHPINVMVTLFFAMVGLFDPEILFRCEEFSFVVIPLFIGYLSTQMIVLLNMLIHIMGDTFDRVKSTQEQQLLMGRARFIDACEAALTKGQIIEIEKKIGKYLYVLVPLEDNLNEETSSWRGRIKTIEESVKSMIDRSHHSLSQKIEKIEEESKQFQFKAMETLKDLEKNLLVDKNELQKQVEDNSTRMLSSIKDYLQTMKEASNRDVMEMKSEITEAIGNDMRLIHERVNSIEEYLKSKYNI